MTTPSDSVELARRVLEYVDGCPETEWDDEHFLARAVLTAENDREHWARDQQRIDRLQAELSTALAERDEARRERDVFSSDNLRRERDAALAECERLRAEVRDWQERATITVAHSVSEREHAKVTSQLAACRAALVEACDIAAGEAPKHAIVPRGPDEDRIAALRKIAEGE